MEFDDQSLCPDFRESFAKVREESAKVGNLSRPAHTHRVGMETYGESTLCEDLTRAHNKNINHGGFWIRVFDQPSYIINRDR